MNQQIAAKNPAAPEPRIANEAETAEYIGELLSQLERLARSHGLVKLQYLLKACQDETALIAAAR